MHHSFQDPESSDPSDRRRDLQRAVARALFERSIEIADRWRAELEEHGPEARTVREAAPDYGPDPDREMEAEERLVDAVRWVVAVFGGRREDRRDDGPAVIRELGRTWRETGCSLEEGMLRFRILERILYEAVRDELSGMPQAVRAEGALRLAEWLGHAVDLAVFALVRGVREAEADRFSDFGNTLVHEIRNPLGGALAAAQSLLILHGEDDGPEVEAREERLLERLVHALEEANRILTSVSSLVRAREFPSDGEDVRRRPLRDVVREVFREVRREEDADVDLLVEEVPEVEAPEGPVRLALHNLVQNAVRYADPEKPRCWVRVGCRRDEGSGCWWVRVEDNGVGIPADAQRSVFRRFWRGTDRGEGFGLGLSIVEDAVEQLGGEISLRSRPGRGSVFRFSIPFRQCGQAPSD